MLGARDLLLLASRSPLYAANDEIQSDPCKLNEATSPGDYILILAAMLSGVRRNIMGWSLNAGAEVRKSLPSGLYR